VNEVSGYFKGHSVWEQVTGESPTAECVMVCCSVCQKEARRHPGSVLLPATRDQPGISFRTTFLLFLCFIRSFLPYSHLRCYYSHCFLSLFPNHLYFLPCFFVFLTSVSLFISFSLCFHLSYFPSFYVFFLSHCLPLFLSLHSFNFIFVLCT